MSKIVVAEKRRGYALFSVLALIFLLIVLLGIAVTHVGYSYDVVNAYLRRVEARSELTSMTNLALRWLSANLKIERPRAFAVETHERLTNTGSLRIFFSTHSKGGEVEVYDLDYDSGHLAEPVAEPLFFPASFRCAYMIRAAVVKNEMAPLVMESVYEIRPISITSVDIVYVLEDRPLYIREFFRHRPE